MKTYIKFIITTFFRSLIFVSSIILSLVFILNILAELEFFKDLNIDNNFLLFLAVLNSPDLFSDKPFIFLISTQLFLLNFSITMK